MTISDAPLDELNRFAAERIEPKPDYEPVLTGAIGLSVITQASTQTTAWEWDFLNHEWKTRNFETGDGMKILLERMIEKNLAISFTTFADRLCMQVSNCHMTGDDIGVLALRLFCLSEGWTAS